MIGARATICVCTHQRSSLLARTLASLRDATRQGARVIVVDNASTDATPEVAAASGFELVRNERNLGMVGNWNRALELVDTEYGAIFHDDDEYAPDAVARLVAALDAFPTAALAHGGVLVVDESGRPIDAPPLGRAGLTPGPEVAREVAFTGTSRFYAPTVMFRTAALRRAGRFDPALSLAADLDLWARLALEGDVAFVPERILRYRLHVAGGTASSNGYLAALESMEVQRRAAARLRPSLGPLGRARLALAIRRSHLLRVLAFFTGWSTRTPEDPAALALIRARAREGGAAEALVCLVHALPPLRALARAGARRLAARRKAAALAAAAVADPGSRSA